MPARNTLSSMQSGHGVEIQFPSGYVLRASSDVDPADVDRGTNQGFPFALRRRTVRLGILVSGVASASPKSRKW